MDIKKLTKEQQKAELIKANRAYIECIEKNYLPRFFNHENIKITDVCLEEYKRMAEIDKIVYGKFEWAEFGVKPKESQQ